MKKTLCLFLVIALITVCCSCGSVTDTSSAVQSDSFAVAESGTSEQADQAAKDPIVAEEVEPGATTSAEDPAQAVVALPLTETPEEISYWFELSPFAASYVTDMNDNITIQEYENRTNVHVNFVAVSSESSAAFNLMAAGGDMCDIMCYVSRYYSSGSSGAIEDGIIMELSDLVDEYMPNYKRLLESDEDLRRAVTTTSGGYDAVWQIYDTPFANTSGPIVRGDWLEALDMDTPVTYDDWYEMLSAFKTEMGATSPLLLGKDGTIQSLISGYGTYGMTMVDREQYPFYQEENVVKYGAIEDGFKDYLEMMHSWYEAGFFTSDYLNNGQTDAAEVASGNSGVMVDARGAIVNANGQLEGTDGYCIAIPSPVQEAGQLLDFGDPVTSAGAPFSVSATCDNPELVAKWLDYAYTDEGYLLVNYGVEGKTYTMENDVPAFTDLIINNPDGYDKTVALNLYVTDVFPGLRSLDVYNAGYDEVALGAWDVWNSNNSENCYRLPDSFAITSDAAMTFGQIFPDISTYVSESVAGFILGTKPLDEWDSYVETIEGMGIQTCLDLYQEAWNEYIAR